MKKRLLVAIVFVFSTVCGHAQRATPDTVSYGDWRYQFQPMDLDSFDYVWYDGLSWERLFYPNPMYCYLKYSCIQPVTIYGIAVVLLGNGPTLLRVARDGTLSGPLDADSIHPYAYLAQHDGDGIFRRLDSARWRPREPDHYYQFSYKKWFGVPEWRGESDVYDTVMPMYEFYFNRPHTVLGNYYLGLSSDASAMDSLVWMWHVLFIRSNNPYQFRWYYPEPLDCENIWQEMWIGICPIIAPPDTDAIRAIPVEGLRREESWNGRSVFAWDCTPGQLQYQVAYGPASQPPDSHSHFFAYQPRCSLPVADSLLDPTVQYAVRCRAQSRHACALHDTLVWSAWSVPVNFYPSRPDTTLAAFRPPKVEFTLSPNPARDRVAVLLPDGLAGQGTLLIRDMSGRERHRHRVSGQSFSLPIRDLPAGAYFVTVATGQGCTTQKLIVR